ncbi:hypothetical protein C0Q70_03571 [Pomacea canaliculata]|uniref:Uncharacterized protein n=1 Tax=Pomacea canaliculata TaxID=400727 RepID=A0A2T7PT34_POMCA|nr:hypothetical protein C0Q70_03571 [Pomacea canaliculata]
MKPDTVGNSRHESYNCDKGILLTPSLSTTAAVYSKRREREKELQSWEAGIINSEYVYPQVHTSVQRKNPPPTHTTTTTTTTTLFPNIFDR